MLTSILFPSIKLIARIASPLLLSFFAFHAKFCIAFALVVIIENSRMIPSVPPVMMKYSVVGSSIIELMDSLSCVMVTSTPLMLYTTILSPLTSSFRSCMITYPLLESRILKMRHPRLKSASSEMVRKKLCAE
eukprot:TRINITY_DN14006_c0_g1_i2.p2 TRINITY_DN14006_c0_g1~~TRINITY_DN14006_c0_g1_i2.p2  ORF type:complete len:133 (-),score=33.55 TRINITY_DN14006_c0_g1_i2:1503-1901(-)